MAYLARVSLFLRRLGLTFLLTGLMVCLIASFYPDVAGILWLPCWIALFVAWPYLDRKLNFPIFKGRKPRPKRPTAWGRIVVTGFVASGISMGIALLPVPDVLTLSAPLIWIALYYGWPPLSRRLPITESWKAKVRPDETLPPPGFWRFLGRGALATLSLLMMLVLLGMTVMGPIGHSMVRARRVHDSIHVGMTVPEVLDASRDYDLFGAESDFPCEKNAAFDNIPSMGWWRNPDGTYWANDLAAQRSIAMTETQALERLHSKLHDGYPWRFYYTYINMTPMHVSFSVIFGPDGRVSEVKPVHGWERGLEL